MAYTTFVPITGTILNIVRERDCCSQFMSLRVGSGIINFLIGPETQVIENRRLRPGMQVTAFYDSSLPVPLIFPPQYRAQLIAVPGRNEQVVLNYFDRNLLAADGSLQLNLGRNTDIETLNGQSFTCSLGNRNLLVFYSMTTRSIPPQTTPRKIVVLC
ncbi:MAG: hypothetical protein SOZ59_16150 [Candidatus Limivivens sp.]|nr:hypothetical protein [Candidatus Limivivens sp.]